MSFIIWLIFTLMIFENIVTQYIPAFTYFDEFLVMISLISFVYSLKRNNLGNCGFRVKKRYFIMVILIIIIGIVGIVGNILLLYQSNNIAIVKDIVACFKMPICYLGLCVIMKDIIVEKNLKMVVISSKVYLTIFFITGIISQLVDIGMGYDIRGNIVSFKFLYIHPTFLVFSTVIMMVILVALDEKNNLFYFEGLIILFLTRRDKAYAFILAFVLIKYFLKYINKIKIRHVLVILLGGFAISYKKILLYMSYSNSPREQLYRTGFHILKDYFPVGSGFATFASAISGEYYSGIYEHYGIHQLMGITATNYVDMGDVSWPYFYGQFGIFGFLLFIILLIIILKDFRRINYRNRGAIKATYLLVSYIIIASLVEAVFTNASGAYIPLTMSLISNRKVLNSE